MKEQFLGWFYGGSVCPARRCLLAYKNAAALDLKCLGKLRTRPNANIWQKVARRGRVPCPLVPGSERLFSFASGHGSGEFQVFARSKLFQTAAHCLNHYRTPSYRLICAACNSSPPTAENAWQAKTTASILARKLPSKVVREISHGNSAPCQSVSPAVCVLPLNESDWKPRSRNQHNPLAYWSISAST